MAHPIGQTNLDSYRIFYANVSPCFHVAAIHTVYVVVKTDINLDLIIWFQYTIVIHVFSSLLAFYV